MNNINDFYSEYKLLFSQLLGEIGLGLARVVAEHKSQYIIEVLNKEEGYTLEAGISGKYRYGVAEALEKPLAASLQLLPVMAPPDAPGWDSFPVYDHRFAYPTVGDYVGVKLSMSRAVIEKLLPRRTLFYRHDSFGGLYQMVASNFDTAFICMSLNNNFKLARLERYAVMTAESRAAAVAVLTKSDLCDNVDEKLALCRAALRGVPVYAVSAMTGEGLENLTVYFERGKTVVALGSSGVGKSTLVNALFGCDIMKTAEVRADDDRGRHTTVHRQLITLPSGGFFLDTPGMRELGLSDAEDAVSALYDDVENLISECKYSDCRHQSEPGCAVREAIENGLLNEGRFADYIKYKKESAYSDDKRAFMAERQRYAKEISRHVKNIKKSKKR